MGVWAAAGGQRGRSDYHSIISINQIASFLGFVFSRVIRTAWCARQAHTRQAGGLLACRVQPPLRLWGTGRGWGLARVWAQPAAPH